MEYLSSIATTLSVIKTYSGVDAFAVLFSLLAPILIIYVNHELRFRRLRLIDAYDAAFRTKLAPSTDSDSDTGNPTFEYVRAKYVCDIRDSEIQINGSPGSKLKTGQKIDALLHNSPSFLRLSANRHLLWAVACFALITYFGFEIAFEQLACFVKDGSCVNAIQTITFIGGTGSDQEQNRRLGEQVMTVASLAFLGSYVAAIRELLRRMAVFDLSSYTFLKQAAEILASVLGVIFLYRAIPAPVDQTFALVAGSTWKVPEQISLIWLGLAPLFGLFPESATKFLFLQFRNLLKYIKSEDTRFADVTMITPLNVIDGIDYWTRIRLEQCGIADVQGLATYNPIMLFIETPYGIYQIFDWVAQAQLCHIVGIEKFLLFREFNVRTIFDLERAVLSRASPEEFDRVYAGILLAPTASLKQTVEIAKTKFILPEAAGPKMAEATEYCQWAYKTLGANDKAITLAIEHMIRWITDDLHVRRLRRLWLEISASLAKESEGLPDGKPLPKGKCRDEQETCCGKTAGYVTGPEPPSDGETMSEVEQKLEDGEQDAPTSPSTLAVGHSTPESPAPDDTKPLS